MCSKAFSTDVQIRDIPLLLNFKTVNSAECCPHALVQAACQAAHDVADCPRGGVTWTPSVGR